MSKIAYINKRFNSSSELLISQANTIIDEYDKQGFVLTLRQLYYQFVSRDIIPNNMKSYKRLGSVINDARLAGLIDWDAIEDRTRSIKSVAHWDGPGEIVAACAQQFRLDKWDMNQQFRPEVWIEKEALAGVVEGVCRDLDIPYLSCRGYTSQSEMHGSSLRLRHMVNCGQKPVILHFGDHDPSGIDMSRDIQDRLKMFGCTLTFKRLALNMAQVEKYNPPPNPAKVTDARFKAYAAEYGDESWELDALEPALMVKLIRDTVLEFRDEDAWEAAVDAEMEHRNKLTDVARTLSENSNDE